MEEALVSGGVFIGSIAAAVEEALLFRELPFLDFRIEIVEFGLDETQTRAHSVIVGTEDRAEVEFRGEGESPEGQVGGRLMRQYAKLRMPMSMLMISRLILPFPESSDEPDCVGKRPVGRWN